MKRSVSLTMIIAALLLIGFKSTDAQKVKGAKNVIAFSQPDKFGDLDFGYPQLTTNHRGEVIALYYWATKSLLEHHIAGTIWKQKR